MADKFVAGEAEHPWDGPSHFCQELGFMSSESDGEWARIKQTVFDILLRRDLVGKLPLTIHDLATKSAMAEQLEAIHSATFFLLKPSSYRRELVHRIFAYEMTRLRGDVRHRGGGGGGANPQQLMPLQSGASSDQATPEPPARESGFAEPSPAESPVVEPHPAESPVIEPRPAGSPVVEPHPVGPPLVEPDPVESPMMGSQPIETLKEIEAERARPQFLSTEPRPVTSPVTGSHPVEVSEEMDLDQVAPPDPSATGPRALGFPSIEPLPTQMMRGAPTRALAPIPVLYWNKEAVVTAVVPSDPGFQVNFTKYHLRQGSGLSITKLFEVLREEGFQGSPGGYVVVDEFDDRLASQRHLEVAFQLLANKEKLSATWRVLKKAEYEEQFPRAGLLNPPAPRVATSNAFGSSKAGFLGDVPFSESDIDRPAYRSSSPVLPESSPEEGSEMQDRAPPVTASNACWSSKTGFLGDSPFSESGVGPADSSNSPLLLQSSLQEDCKMQTTPRTCWLSETRFLGDGPLTELKIAGKAYPSNGLIVPESSPEGDSEMRDRWLFQSVAAPGACWSSETGYLGDDPFSKPDVARPAYPSNGPVLPKTSPKEDSEMQGRAPPATTSDACRLSDIGFFGDGPFAESETAGPAYPSKSPIVPESSPKEGSEMQDQADGSEEPQLPDPPKVKKKAFLDISDWDSDDSS